MNRHLDDESGFGVVELALIVVIVALIGFLGWLVYDKHRTTKSTSGDTTQNTKSTSSAGTAAYSSAGVAKIPELGIQFNIPASLNDLTYKVVQTDYSDPGNNSLGVYPTAYFSTKELDAAEGGVCAISKVTSTNGGNPPLGFLTKTTGQYPESPTADNSTGGLKKQFSTYYLAFRSSGNPCFNDDANNLSAVLLINQLSTALDSVTEIK